MRCWQSCRPNFPASSSISRNICRTTSRKRCRASKARTRSSCSATICRRSPTPPTRSRRCWRPCRASPTLRYSRRSASRRCRSTSIAHARRATGSRQATSTRPFRLAIGGDSAGDLYEPGSDRHFPIVVRLAPQFRQERRRHPEPAHRRCKGRTDISQIPLSEVATVKLVSGASYIYREQQERYLPIKFSVRDRDLGSAILEAQTEDRRAGAAAAGLSPRMGRRVRQPAGCDRASEGRGADQPRPDRAAAVDQFRLGTGHAARHERDPDGGDRRRSSALFVTGFRSASRPRSASSRCSASRSWTASSSCRSSIS